ncbi:MAG TPA: M28 family peptidase [Thermoanaerobaculia bacterium]
MSLRDDIEMLAATIGERNLARYASLRRAADYIASRLGTVERQAFDVDELRCENLIHEVQGSVRPKEIVVIGAHYDSVFGSPGANDNATGVAALLALAATVSKPARTVRFAAFVNEEPPYFTTEAMGSLVYARRCHERGEKIVAMLSLETIGFYSDAANSQAYPVPLSLIYPAVGNFIGFVSNVRSAGLLRRVVKSFRAHTDFPAESIAAPDLIPGIGWSDQWSFWQCGYPAVMVTDTALYRDPTYHTARDTPEHIDYDRLERVVEGLRGAVGDLSGGPSGRPYSSP